MSNDIRILQRIVSRRGSSKVLSFGEPHVFKALQILNKEGYVSRKSFCNHLALGEGAIKTLILHLREEGLVESVRAGTFLTKKGRKFVTSLLQLMPADCFVPNPKFVNEKNSHAVLLHQFGKYVKTGIEQRDAAIIYGASSTMTMIFNKGKFVFPGEESDCFKSDFETRKLLLEKLKPNESDVVILASAGDPFTAEFAAKNSALVTISH